jgi:transposase
MNKHFRITLTLEERADLEELTRRGAMNVRALKRAWILLKADEGPGGPGWSDGAIGRALDVHPNTVLRLRRRFVAHGLADVLHGRYTGHNPAIVTGDVEARLVTLACSAPPEGREHWTLQLLADELVALGVVAHLSDETVRQALKKTPSSPG